MPDISTQLPTFEQLLQVAPVATITVLILLVGWWLGSHSSQKTIDALKEFIEYLKGKDRD